MPAISTRRILLAFLGFLPMTSGAWAMPWRLITREEEQRDKEAPDAPAQPDRPPPPIITLVRPDISRPIRNPEITRTIGVVRASHELLQRSSWGLPREAAPATTETGQPARAAGD